MIVKRKTVSMPILALLLTAMLTVVISIQPASGSGTIYIRADGSIDPPTAPISNVDNVLYTFTADISGTIVVERDNVVIDGADHTLQGSGSTDSFGIGVWHRSGVTIKNMRLVMHGYGIWLRESSNSLIFENTFELNHYYGILLDNSSNDNNVRDNSVSTTSYAAIGLYSFSENNSIVGNTAVGNQLGVVVSRSSNNIISGNHIANNGYGVTLMSTSDDNIISGNIVDQNGRGLELLASPSRNTISGNSITNNMFGMFINSSSANSIYHNNFFNNSYMSHTLHAYTVNSTNLWDNGYPSGGNWWSDYSGADLFSGPYQNRTGSDGICDTAHEIDADNRDRYPLMAPCSRLGAGTWHGTPYNVDVLGNSTVSGFQVNPGQKTISFNVTGDEGTSGFCRITIPNAIIADLWQGNYTVLLNGEPWRFTNWTDPANTYIYINYTHSQHEIIIIPEFSPSMLLPLFMALSAVALVFAKKKLHKKTEP